MFKCFVLGLNFGLLAILRAPELSSNTLQYTFVCGCLLTIIRCRHSVRSDSDRATYSASVVLRTISWISREAQVIGQPANLMMYPRCDRVVSESSPAVSRFHVPAKSASAYTSNNSSSGWKLRPSAISLGWIKNELFGGWRRRCLVWLSVQHSLICRVSICNPRLHCVPVLSLLCSGLFRSFLDFVSL